MPLTRDFHHLWRGQTASLFASFTSQLTVPLTAVTALSAGATQLGLLRAVEQLPILLLSLHAGVLADRVAPRTVMTYSDLARAALLATIPLTLAVFSGLTILYVVAFVVGIFTVLFDISYQSALPRLVRSDQIAKGNSLLETTRSAAQITGPALAGALVSLLAAPLAVLPSAVLFAVSGLSISRIRSRVTGTPTGSVRQEIADGLRQVIHHPALRAIAMATCVYQFSFTALTTVYLLFLTRTLGLPAATTGIVLASFGPGVLIGSLISAWLPRRFGYRAVMVFAALISDVVMLTTSLLHGNGVPTIAALIAINVVFGVFSQAVDVSVTSLRQLRTPLEVQGRVAATINFLGLGLTPVGALLGGAAAGWFGVRAALLLATVGLFLSPLCLSRLQESGGELPSRSDSVT